MKPLIRSLINQTKNFLSLIIPPRCLCCGVMVSEPRMLCPSCWGDISFISNPQCKICGFPFEYDMGNDAICASCSGTAPAFDKARSSFRYNEKSRKIITSFKYSDRTYGTRTYAGWMKNSGEDFFADADIITFVPMHWIKLLSRKYNQAALLANRMGEVSSKPVTYNLLIRKKNSRPQASLSRAERLKNVKGAFKLNKRYNGAVDGKNILLVDDVMTTGATISECSKILKKAGAAKVYVLTLARTVGNE